MRSRISGISSDIEVNTIGNRLYSNHSMIASNINQTLNNKKNMWKYFAFAGVGLIVLVCIIAMNNMNTSFFPSYLKTLHAGYSSRSCASLHHNIQSNQRSSNESIDVHVYDVIVLRSKLAGVSYEGGHWFHIAENFLTHHTDVEDAVVHDAVARNVSSLQHAHIVRHLVYVLDNNKFIEQMNAITRMFVVLGTLDSASLDPHNTNIRPRYAHFVSFTNNDDKDDISALIASIGMGKTVDLDVSVPTDDRFAATLPSAQILARIKHQEHTCVRYQGSVGGNWPTPQRGHWLPRQHDLDTLRYKIASLCPPTAALKKSVKKKIVIYQRDVSRKLENEAEAIQLLRDNLPDPASWDIHVLIHKSSRSPCSLAHQLFDADVLITPHGFQSMLLLFMPKKSILFEVFPYKYYKRGYGPLSKEFGIIHVGAMSPPTSYWSKSILSLVQSMTCMASKQCRNYARNHDVRLMRAGVMRLQEKIMTHNTNMNDASMHLTSIFKTSSNATLTFACQLPADPKTSSTYLFNCY